MARNPKPTKKTDRRPRPTAPGAGRARRGRPKVCLFCTEHATWVDYKDVGLLKKYMNDRGRIRARGATGTCAQHQRDVAAAIKTARELAMLPYVVRTTAADSRGRGGDRRRSLTASAESESGTDRTESASESGADGDDAEESVPSEPESSSAADSD